MIAWLSQIKQAKKSLIEFLYDFRFWAIDTKSALSWILIAHIEVFSSFEYKSKWSSLS